MKRLKRKKQLKRNKGIIKISILRVIVLLIILGLNWTGLSAVTETIAYFNDIENSDTNVCQIGTLDFSLDLLRPDGFRTQTQGGWGAGAKGDNPGVYRDANFDSAFPSGLTVGDEILGYYAHFTSSINIENFLPAGGTAAPFSKIHENPIQTKAGILAGQAVALTLNIGFDNYDPDFSINQSKLKDFYANEEGSPCQNMTAGQVLAEANKILSGKSSGFSPSAINECLTEINERFVDGLTKKITPYESTWRQITIVKESSLNFQHNIRVEQISGDTDLCQALNVNAHLNGMPVYSGSLLNFVYGPTVFSNSTNQWKLYISLPSNAPLSLQNKTCEFKYIINGWQENMSILESGFSDVEEVSDSIDSGNWDLIVLNEFLPNPEGVAYGYDFGDDNSTMPQGEWVELYNNNNVSYDLGGWYIWDASGDNSNKIFITSSNTYPASTTISAKTWLVVYMNKEVLDNTGDTVKLFNNTDTLVDLYTYTGDDNYCEIEPTPGDENATETIGDCSSVPPNKSYARIPDGVGAWVDPIPTPGRPNIIESEDIIFETTVLELNEEVVNDEVLVIEEELEPESIETGVTMLEEELIIIDGLFLASPPQNALDFPLEEEPIIEEETVHQEEPVADEELIIIEEIINEEINPDISPIEETINEEILTKELLIIEEPLIVEETLIIEEPVIEEVINQVVDETIVEGEGELGSEPEPEPEPEPELEQIEEVQALPEPEPELVVEEESNDENK